MGHSRIGVLPATRKWKAVVSLLAAGADEAKVANAVLEAAGGTFARIRDDPGFRAFFNLMTEIALASGQRNPLPELAAIGIEVPKQTSLLEIVHNVAAEFDRRVQESRRPSDIAEMTYRSLVGAFTDHFQAALPALYEPADRDVAAAFHDLSKPKKFGQVFRDFTSRLTNEVLENFLTRTLGSDIGAGHRHATTTQIASFKHAMKVHCDEAAGIMETFAGDWLSSKRRQGGGKISRERSEAFGWAVFKKMTMELMARAKDDGR